MSRLGDVNPLLQTIVGNIAVRSNYGPDIDIADPFAQGESSAESVAANDAGNPFLALLQPEVVITGPDGSTVAVAAPYGVPGPTKWPILAPVMILGVLALSYYAYRGIKHVHFSKVLP